jgi:hypothetical protein
MSRYDDPKEGTVIAPIVINTDMHSFLCRVYESSERRELEIGGKEVYCMKIQAYKATSSYARAAGIDTSVAVLHEIKFDEFCSLAGKFRPGASTTHLLMLGLTVLRNMFKPHKHIKTVKLDDASYKMCSNNSTIDFAFTNYLVHGKTWYERVLDARLSPSDQAVFDAQAKQFHNKKKEIPWISLKAMIGNEIPEWITQELYESAETWQDFFKPIYEKIGSDSFCVFMSPWLFALKDLMNYNFHKTYYFDLYSPKLQTILYTARPARSQAAGRSTTRKSKRIRISNAAVRHLTDFDI